MAARKVLQVPLDAAEYDALQEQCKASGAASLADWARQTLRQGLAVDELLALQTLEAERRRVDRGVSRVAVQLMAQAVLMLQTLATPAAVEAAQAQAPGIADELFAEGDALEAVLTGEDGAGQPGSDQ